ncbi:oocyte zinc finger protein XlCOF28-like isoform X5 [Lucilia sericata]|uniref:oocyte zinc finger protein XlCOF28-like isoform X5 n=1 Tax=Lucilia sericata TaxID=13632 RepID=UPI0018A8463E|nr:oocyte zinc finger protein XlCOF28-like isoform X5 [Lucilia sericata]
MSVDIIESITIPPLKRLRSSSESNTSKCGEVFVTNCADKWTFYCSHCQLSTTDIGVFVCHIRLQHLNQQQQQQTPAQETPQNDTPITIASSRQNVAVLTPTPPPPMTSIPRDNLIVPEIVTAKEPENEQMQSDIVKEEPTVSMNQSNMDYEAICSKVSKIVDISTLTQPESNNETTADVPSDKNPLVKNEAFGEQIIMEQQKSQENIQYFVITDVVENNNDKEGEKITLTSDEEDGDEDDDDNDNDGYEDNDDDNILTEEHITSLKCTYCYKLFDDKTTVLNHIKTHHLMNNIRNYPYSCLICKKGFKSKNGLKGHSSSHEGNNQLQCPVCLSKFYKPYFVTHVLIHESETCFPCQVCGEIYDSHEKRLDHWHTHEKDQPYGCNYCFRRYKKEKYLIKHLKVHKAVKCSSCKTGFHATDTRPPFFCRSCMKERIKELQAKYRQTAEEISINLEEDDSQEDDSDVEFITDENKPRSSGSLYKKKLPAIPEVSDTQTTDEDSDVSTDSDVEFVDALHKPDDSNPSRAAGDYMCCGKNFHNDRNLNAHIARMHKRNKKKKRRKHKCHLCKKSFKIRSSLVYHIRTHDINNQFECPICPYAEFRESEFLAHVKSHESPTCYPCQVCAEIFHTQEERLEHWHTHAEEKPCACHICYRRFTKTFILTNHMRVHGIYMCQFCGDNFESTVTPGHPYVCGKCEEDPEIKKTVEHQRTLPSNKRVLDSIKKNRKT